MRSRVRLSDSAPYCPIILEQHIMSSEWHEGENSVNLENIEIQKIQNELDHLDTIMSSVFGNLEEFDQYGGEATVYDSENNPIGLKLIHAIYGEEAMTVKQDSYKFEQFNKVIIGNEYVAILIRQDGSIRDIQTNIENHTPGNIYKWLTNAYMNIDYILDSPTLYLEREDFIYHGPDETEEANRLRLTIRGR